MKINWINAWYLIPRGHVPCVTRLYYAQVCWRAPVLWDCYISRITQCCDKYCTTTDAYEYRYNCTPIISHSNWPIKPLMKEQKATSRLVNQTENGMHVQELQTCVIKECKELLYMMRLTIVASGKTIRIEYFIFWDFSLTGYGVV